MLSVWCCHVPYLMLFLLQLKVAFLSDRLSFLSVQDESGNELEHDEGNVRNFEYALCVFEQWTKTCSCGHCLRLLSCSFVWTRHIQVEVKDGVTHTVVTITLQRALAPKDTIALDLYGVFTQVRLCVPRGWCSCVSDSCYYYCYSSYSSSYSILFLFFYRFLVMLLLLLLLYFVHYYCCVSPPHSFSPCISHWGADRTCLLIGANATPIARDTSTAATRCVWR